MRWSPPFTAVRKWKLKRKISMVKKLKFLTQKSVVRLRSEQLLDAVEVEAERQEDFDIGSFGEKILVDFLRVLQVGHAHGVVSFLIAHGVERVHHLKLISKRIKFPSPALDGVLMSK